MSNHAPPPRVNLSPNARHVVARREGPNVGRALVVNSCLIRYDAMVTAAAETIERKFHAREREALIAVFAHPAARGAKSLWHFDNPLHREAFCTLVRRALEGGTAGDLDRVERGKLLDVLESRLSTLEFLALCDWLSLQGAQARALIDG